MTIPCDDRLGALLRSHSAEAVYRTHAKDDPAQHDEVELDRFFGVDAVAATDEVSVTIGSRWRDSVEVVAVLNDDLERQALPCLNMTSPTTPWQSVGARRLWRGPDVPGANARPHSGASIAVGTPRLW